MFKLDFSDDLIARGIFFNHKKLVNFYKTPIMF